MIFRQEQCNFRYFVRVKKQRLDSYRWEWQIKKCDLQTLSRDEKPSVWAYIKLIYQQANLTSAWNYSVWFLYDKVSGLQHFSLVFFENNSIFRTEVCFLNILAWPKVLTFVFILEYIWTFYFCFRNTGVVLNFISSMSIINVIDVISFVLFLVELSIFWRIFIQQQQQNSSSDSKLLLWAIKSEFRTSFSRGIDNRKDQRSKIPVSKYEQNSAVCVADLVLLNLKISRQKRRCRPRPLRKSDVRDDKNVCCLSSLKILHYPPSISGGKAAPIRK